MTLKLLRLPLLLAAFAGLVLANGTISFTQPNTVQSIGGVNTLHYAGGANMLTGNNIAITTTDSAFTPVNSFVPLKCVGCVLNFNTGASVGNWAFGSGPAATVSITGQLFDLANNLVSAGPLLLQGFFNGVGTDAPKVTTSNTGGTLHLAGGATFTTLDPALTAYYFGNPVNPFHGTLSINFLTRQPAFAANAFVSGALTGATLQSDYVPEPISWMFFGTATVALGLVAARRRPLG